MIHVSVENGGSASINDGKLGVTWTRIYADGTTATGPEPLPDYAPEGATKMSETLQRYTVHKLYGGSISAEPDGNYVLYADAQRRIEELEKALRTLLEAHCCDSGEANYKAEWEGDHTVCADCKQARAVLRK